MSNKPELSDLFFKIENEQDLTTVEVREIFYHLECEDESLYDVLCVIHAALDTGLQGDIDSLAECLKQWAKKENIIF